MYNISDKLEISNMANIQYVWESLKTVNGLVDVFETCIDFGLNLTDAKKVAQKWQLQKGAVL